MKKAEALPLQEETVLTHNWCVSFNQTINIFDVDSIANRRKMEIMFPKSKTTWVVVETFISYEDALQFIQANRFPTKSRK